MKKILLVIVSLAIGIPLVIWLYEKFGLASVLETLSLLRPWQLLILFFLNGVTIFIWVLRWKLILEGLEKKDFYWRDLTEARLGEQAISYLTPGIHYGGEVVRILMLRKKRDVPLIRVTLSVILDRLMEFMGLCMFSFLGAAALVIKGDYAWASFLAGLAIFILLVLILIFKLVGIRRILIFLARFIPKKRVGQAQRGITSLARKVEFVGSEASTIFRRVPHIFYRGTILSCLVFFIGAFEIGLFIFFLGGRFALINTFPMRVLISLSGLIPISASLGVYEGASILAFSSFGIGASIGLGYSLLRRLIDFTAVFIGISFVLRYFTHGLMKIGNNH